MNSSKYRQLKVVLHQASSPAAALVDKEYDSRFNSPSALHWNYRVKKNLVFVNVVDELAVLLEQVWRSELAIQKYWRVLPRAAREQYLISLLVSEIQATNEIEGIHSTRKEIRLAIKAAEKSSKGEAYSRRFQEMAQTYLLLFGGLESGTAQFPKDLAGTESSMTSFWHWKLLMKTSWMGSSSELDRSLFQMVKVIFTVASKARN